jgi:tetratricopeptide (TPR) repeat protein
VEFVTLCNQLGRPERALELLRDRRFSPWEGGEGLVSGQYVWSHLLLGRARLQAGHPEEALAHFEAARTYPHNLGEGKHLLTLEAHLDYYSGVALDQAGRDDEARERWKAAVEATAPLSWMRYFQALSLAALGKRGAARAALQEMRAQALVRMRGEVKIDYFATSLPNFLLFEDDLAKRNQIDCLFLIALADLGLGQSENAATGFKKVLSLDRNHLAAQEQSRELEQRLAVLR